MNFELNKKNIILISVVLGLLILANILIHLERNSNKENVQEEKIRLVDNYSNFYTVSSCVYRYLTYLQSKDTDSLMKVLDEEFITSNGVNENNVYNFLNTYETNVSFNARKMMEEKINNNITKYYVYGYVEKDIIDNSPEQIDAYFIVKLDKQEQVFTIMPYSGEILR